MSKKLFVGGLSWDTTDQSLRAAFETYGPVREARVILDRETGRSRGFGFVSFDDDAAAIEAISKMNGAMLDGRTIRVNEAEERRGPGGPPRGDRRGPPRGGFDRGGPEIHTRGRSSYGGPGRERDSGPRPYTPPPAMPLDPGGENAGWEDARERRDFDKKRKKKKTTTEDEFSTRAPAAKKRRRESGRTWRDYDLDDDDMSFD